MSHHLDSPASRRDPRLNVTDLYAFDGDGATVLAMIVNSSLAGAGRIPGFHPEGRYEFKMVGTTAAFSFAGFNGRALADNAPEVMYGLITNSAMPTGLVAAASETRQDKFPYVVPA